MYLKQDIKEQLLTKKPIDLLFQLSIPAVIGMIVIGLYPLMDGIFAGKIIGQTAMTACGVAMPLTFFNSGVSTLLGVGSASVLSRAIGKGDQKTVDKIMGNLIYWVIFFSVIITVGGILLAPHFLDMVGATGEIKAYGIRYLRVIFIGSLFVNFTQSANMVMRGEGLMKKAMTIMGLGALLNIILDPILMTVMGEYAIEGAALATITAHIVSECNFDDIIYLKKNGNTVIAKSFNSLKEEYGGDEQKGFKFVKQYLTINRSELFFADKAICIEGDTERILMPMMMHKIDNKEKPKADLIPLLSQNISIIEVGAHSHIFIPLFKFLGIKVLIITDIDAANKKDNGRYVKSNPKEAKYTSNASIKEFFKDTGINTSNNQFKELVEKNAEDKIKDNMRIAYQIPESDGEYQASSFEDAFIALNKDFIVKNKKGFCEYGALKNFNDDDISSDYYNFALNKVEKKSAFASSILYFDDENGEDDEKWRVPKYIEEGLLWIR